MSSSIYKSRKTSVNQVKQQASANLSQLKNLEEFISRHLQWFLGYDVDDQVMEHLFSLTASEMIEYFQELLINYMDDDQKKDKKRTKNIHAFLVEVEKRRHLYDQEQQEKKQRSHPSRIDQQNLERVGLVKLTKEDHDDRDIAAYGVSKKKKKPKNQQQQQHNNKRTNQNQTASKPQKRVPCECQATIHELIRNCLRCGKIICESEGHGECLFCKEFLQTLPPQYEPDMMQRSGDGALAKAIATKDALLQRDRSAHHAHVIDDQMDYYETDHRWMSKEERDAVRKEQEEKEKAEEEARNKITISFDLAGRKIVHENDRKAIDDQALKKLQETTLLPKVESSANDASSSNDANNMNNFRQYANPFLTAPAPKWVATKASESHSNPLTFSSSPKQPKTKQRPKKKTKKKQHLKKVKKGRSRLQHNEREEVDAM